MKISPVGIVALACVVAYVSAYTQIDGVIRSDTEWNQAGSPYVFTGPVGVADDVTLRIQPGTVVNVGPHHLNVHGNLQATGATFNGDGDDSVQGTVIRLSGSLDNTSLRNCKIHGSTGYATLLRLEKGSKSPSGTLKLDNVMFTNGTVDLYNANYYQGEAVAVDFAQCKFTQGTIYPRNTNTTMTRCDFSHFRVERRSFEYERVSITQVNDCTFTSFSTFHVVGNATFSNCKFLNNSQISSDSTVDRIDITNCEFSAPSNMSTEAITLSAYAATDASQLNIIRSTFTGFHMAIAVRDTRDLNVTMDRCQFYDNSYAYYRYPNTQHTPHNNHTQIHNCIFARNIRSVFNGVLESIDATRNFWSATTVEKVQSQIVDSWYNLDYGKVYFVPFCDPFCDGGMETETERDTM